MSYHKVFDPGRIHRMEGVEEDSQSPAADRRGALYFFSDRLILAINVALVSGRPLLLVGPPGSGKSTVARHIAHRLNWRYYQETITSQTRAQELLYRLDLLKRLYEANSRESLEKSSALTDWTRYLTPGIFWWAFRPEDAAKLSTPAIAQRKQDPRNQTQRLQPFIPRPGSHSPPGAVPAVVLLDEIDKADPDVPNNLLQALGRLEFEVQELDIVVQVNAAEAPLIVITSNEERSLPDAFVRRCVVFRLATPSESELLELAREFFAPTGFSVAQKTLCQRLVAEFMKLLVRTPGRKPSTAELLDLVEIALQWELTPDAPELQQLLAATVVKDLSAPLEDT